MIKDLTAYCQIYENYFDTEFCKKIIESLKTVEWGLHRYYTQEGTHISTNTDLSVSYDSIPESNEMHHATWNLLDHYQKTLNFPWFRGWHGMTAIRFNKYDQSTNMMPHCDHIHDLFDGERKGIPIISIVGVLNDDYQGGEFTMWDDQKINLPQGTVMIFPSNFLYPHQVKPIISGTRYSFVQWMW